MERIKSALCKLDNVLKTDQTTMATLREEMQLKRDEANAFNGRFEHVEVIIIVC